MFILARESHAGFLQLDAVLCLMSSRERKSRRGLPSDALESQYRLQAYCIKTKHCEHVWLLHLCAMASCPDTQVETGSSLLLCLGVVMPSAKAGLSSTLCDCVNDGFVQSRPRHRPYGSLGKRRARDYEKLVLGRGDVGVHVV